MPQLHHFRSAKMEEKRGGKWKEKTRKGEKRRAFKSKRRGC